MKKVLSISLIYILLIGCESGDKKIENEVEIEHIVEIEDKSLDSTTISFTNLLTQFPEFNDYTINTESNHFHIVGDFYGDKIDDIAILVEISNETKIAIIDYGIDTIITFIGNKEDSLGDTDYSWIGVFETVESGDTLWSNYEDDWRHIDEVPLNEKVVLSYDAIYAHASESCGGGFIFWRENKWNWLQQE